MGEKMGFTAIWDMIPVLIMISIFRFERNCDFLIKFIMKN